MKKRDVCCNITEEKTMQTRKKVKKISSNVSNLSKRIKSDFSSNAYNQVEKMINNLKGTPYFVVQEVHTQQVILHQKL